MSIAVTGALGFIGAAVVKELNNRERGDITLVDYPDDSEKWKNLSGLVYSDFVHPKDFNPAEHEVVFHLGADSSTGITFQEAFRDFEYTKSLFRMTPDSTRIVYASSAGTYGTDSTVFDEDVWELRPRSPYAVGKHMLDMYVDEHCKDNVVGLKYSNVYGPGEYHKGKMASMIFQWFNMIQEGKETPLFEPDDVFARDFIYVKDAARMTVDFGLLEDEFSRLDGAVSGIYNLGTGTATLFKEILYGLYSMLEVKPNIKRIPLPESLASQYQPYTCLNMDKTTRVIERHKFDIHQGMSDYLAYLKESRRIGEPPCQQE